MIMPGGGFTMNRRDCNPLAALMKLPWWLAFAGGLFVAIWAMTRMTPRLRIIEEPIYCEDE